MTPVGTCPRGGPCARAAPLAVNHAQVATSFRSPLREGEREGGREGKPRRPLPLSPLTCKQASGEREGEKREERLTRFTGLWSINGLHRNSKTTPTISTGVVGVGCKCMCRSCVCFRVLSHVCTFAALIVTPSPVAASKQESQDFASSLVLFSR